MTGPDTQSWRVRISSRERIVGAGTLVASDTVLTCAHVVSTVVGADLADEVTVDFPASAVRGNLPAVARRDSWLPADDDGADLALLSIRGTVPADVRPAALRPCGAPRERRVRAFGHPPGQPGGVWTTAQLVGTGGAPGWMQFDGLGPAGRPVASGFSGAGVVDGSGAVVGIVVAADRMPGTRVAWMIPTEVILAHLPALRPASAAAATRPPATRPPATPPAATPPAAIPPADLQRLARALAAIPLIADPGSRAQVIAALPAEIAAAVPRHNTLLVDVYGIIRTCLDYPGGLAALVSIIRSFAGNSVAVAHVDELLTELGLDTG